jgi:hypothetical protein
MCHSTQAWVPSAAKDHPWWPLQNKHVDLKCTSCHTKGFKVGDTSKDCASCHQKDYDGVADPKHKDLFPLDCAMCHTDVGFKPSKFNHDTFPLDGRHNYRITACASCHTGTPPVYKGTPRDCYSCHKNDFDVVGPSKNPTHKTFPQTCLDCHLMSGWTQGPPLAGLHPDNAQFSIKSGNHAVDRTKVNCQDCHKLEKGLAAGGANTDCVNCHVGSHQQPAIDAKHHALADAGIGTGYDQKNNGATNFCLGCHPAGVK